MYDCASINSSPGFAKNKMPWSDYINIRKENYSTYTSEALIFFKVAWPT